MHNQTLLIASRNVHKIRELKAMLKQHIRWDILSLIDFPQYIPPEERGSSFEDNAIAKALHAATTLKLWALGEDSGLIVPSLGGAPGISSSHYAGPGATDKENRKKLLQEMTSFKEHERDAYFISCLALASPEILKKSSCAQCEGTIVEVERGRHGFGYDSLFLKHSYGKTFGELEEEVKNRISHRRKAFDKLFNLSNEFISE